MRVRGLSHQGLVVSDGQSLQMFTHFAAQQSIGAVDEQFTVVVGAQRIASTRREGGSQLPASVVLLLHTNHFYMVHVDPGVVPEPLPRRHGTKRRDFSAVNRGPPSLLAQHDEPLPVGVTSGSRSAIA